MEEEENKQIKEEKAKGGVREMERLREKRGITLIALVVTMVLHYDKVKKCSNSNSFLLSSI